MSGSIEFSHVCRRFPHRKKAQQTQSNHRDHSVTSGTQR
ncbi:hypothetical protein CSB93_1346 [Pseudomonas paraeruginosa]|uniref:Uncharacterized protein n=1 Tax=Pseudomonas paraeruginosa TaxID=2994495 RepID=A0A2R3J407_9PSED|nr:hypothetical protein CSB93_1346 [Pseudomonas paraeruginosa]AWE94698.1 hypothetical protein CSC28_0116 [Pseudomonas paraeruginosa]